MTKFTRILKELLDKPLPWKLKGELNSGKIIYTFATEKGTEYIVLFDPTSDRQYTVTFIPRNGHLPSSMTGEGDSIAILSTVSEIVENFAQKFSDKFDSLKIQGSKNEEEKSEDSKRFRLYMMMLKKKVDPSKYSLEKTGDNEVTVTKISH